jgi:hypothetical protein
MAADTWPEGNRLNGRSDPTLDTAHAYVESDSELHNELHAVTGQPPIDDGPFSDCDPWHARHNANRIRPWLQPGLEAHEMTVTVQRHLGAFSGAKGGYLTVQATRSARHFTAVPTRQGNLTVD